MICPDPLPHFTEAAVSEEGLALEALACAVKTFILLCKCGITPLVTGSDSGNPAYGMNIVVIAEIAPTRDLSIFRQQEDLNGRSLAQLEEFAEKPA